MRKNLTIATCMTVLAVVFYFISQPIFDRAGVGVIIIANIVALLLIAASIYFLRRDAKMSVGKSAVRAILAVVDVIMIIIILIIVVVSLSPPSGPM